MRITTLALAIAAIASPAVPGTSPMDHAAMSRALTSSQIDNNTLGTVAGNGGRRAGAAKPARKSPPARRQVSPEAKEACAHSTPILKSMGLQPHPDCL